MMPAESNSNSASRPAFRTQTRIISSAAADRQMLPRQTNSSFLFPDSFNDAIVVGLLNALNNGTKITKKGRIPSFSERVLPCTAPPLARKTTALQQRRVRTASHRHTLLAFLSAERGGKRVVLTRAYSFFFFKFFGASRPRFSNRYLMSGFLPRKSVYICMASLMPPGVRTYLRNLSAIS